MRCSQKGVTVSKTIPMCPECRVNMWHQQTSPTSALACLVATVGGCAAETHFLCSWEEGGLLFFPLALYRESAEFDSFSCVEAQEAASWSLCFSVWVSLELDFGSENISKRLFEN